MMPSIQQDRVDREAHPDGVHGPTVAQEQTLVWREGVAAFQAADALAPRLRHVYQERSEPLASHHAAP
jgi:hypothetical protein